MTYIFYRKLQYCAKKITVKYQNSCTKLHQLIDIRNNL